MDFVGVSDVDLFSHTQQQPAASVPSCTDPAMTGARIERLNTPE